MRKRETLLWSLAIVAALSVPGSASASESFCHTPPENLPPVLPEPVQPCATTVFTGDATAYVRITLPEEVTIQNPAVTGDSDFSIVGEGRFVGFALVEDSPGLLGSAWLGGRLPSSADSQLFFVSVDTFGEEEISSYEIPAGNYRLFLLRDGGPATVTLQLNELSGALTVPVRHPVPYELRFPEEYQVPSLSSHIYAAGGVARLEGRGMLFEMAWFHADAHAYAEADTCFFEGAPPEPWGYVPACTLIAIASMGNLPPNHYKGESRSDTGPETVSRLHVFYGDWVPAKRGLTEPGDWGQSLVLEAASQLGPVDSLALWLNYS